MRCTWRTFAEPSPADAAGPAPRTISGSLGIDVGESGSEVEFVWGLEGDRAAGEHHEGEGGLGAVEAVGAAGD